MNRKELITIMMLTYNRNEFLSDINHPTYKLASLDEVDQLIIIWNNIGQDVPKSIYDAIDSNGISDKVRFVFPKQNKLINRFYHYGYIHTNCIFSVDDDYFVDELSLLKCYDIWNNDNDTLSGVVARHMTKSTYSYKCMGKNDEPYNLLLTGAAMFDVKYMDLFYLDEYKDIRDMINTHFNGEDISFNYIHVYYSKHAPIYVNRYPYPLCNTWKRDENSISLSKGHLSKRYKIFDFLYTKFGDVLKTTTHKEYINE